jgi:mannose-6-phosphate isomerase
MSRYLHLYPLAVERKLVQRIWGGQRLATRLRLNGSCPARLGETWEVFDTNVIRNGHLAGQTLSQVAARYGAQLVGTRPLARYGAGFPLLIKFIDANDRLSLQVHPNDGYAHTYEAVTGFHGKTEAWYILEAEPGADIIYGLSQYVDRAGFEAAVHAGNLEPLLQRVPVNKGDIILVPAGTLHAINAGIVLFEIQEKSDLTYRVYDYGRIDSATGKRRELHLQKALDVMDMTPSLVTKQRSLPLEEDGSRTLLVACSHFALEHWQITSEQSHATSLDSLAIVTVIEGRGTFAWEEGNLDLCAGESLVLPAALGGWALRPAQGSTMLHALHSYVPDLERDVIQPLKEQGYQEEQIERLVTRT